MKRIPVRKLAVTAMLSAVTVILGMTPMGMIPLGPVRATTLYLPVIIGAIIEGPIVGLAVGSVFGLFSMYQAAFMPTSPVSVLFLNPLVALLPRIFIGPVSYVVYSSLKKLFSKKFTFLPAAFAGAAGAMTNSIGVLGMLYLLYAQEYVSLLQITDRTAGVVIWGILISNSLPEALVSVAIITAVERALRKGGTQWRLYRPRTRKRIINKAQVSYVQNTTTYIQSEEKRN